jgi:hypothetical protein
MKGRCYCDEIVRAESLVTLARLAYAKNRLKHCFGWVFFREKTLFQLKKEVEKYG